MHNMEASSDPDDVFDVAEEADDNELGPRVIRVASPGSPPASVSLRRSRPVSSSHHAGKWRRNSSSGAGGTRIKAGQTRLSSGFQHPQESRVLPSCQANTRRNSWTGKGSQDVRQRLARQESESALDACSHHSEVGHGDSITLGESSRNDSGVIPDVCPTDTSLSSSVRSSTTEDSSCGDSLGNSVNNPSSLLKHTVTGSDGHRHCDAGIALQLSESSQDGDQRRFSESELLDRCTYAPDNDGTAHAQTVNIKEISLQSSVQPLEPTDNAVSVQSSDGALQASTEWKLSLQSVHRTDGTTSLSSDIFGYVPDSLREDNDFVKEYWTSKEGLQSANTQHHMSSDDSTEDVFLSAEGSADEGAQDVGGTFGSKTSDSLSETTTNSRATVEMHTHGNVGLGKERATGTDDGCDAVYQSSPPVDVSVPTCATLDIVRETKHANTNNATSVVHVQPTDLSQSCLVLRESQRPDVVGQDVQLSSVLRHHTQDTPKATRQFTTQQTESPHAPRSTLPSFANQQTRAATHRSQSETNTKPRRGCVQHASKQAAVSDRTRTTTADTCESDALLDPDLKTLQDRASSVQCGSISTSGLYTKRATVSNLDSHKHAVPEEGSSIKTSGVTEECANTERATPIPRLYNEKDDMEDTDHAPSKQRNVDISVTNLHRLKSINGRTNRGQELPSNQPNKSVQEVKPSTGKVSANETPSNACNKENTIQGKRGRKTPSRVEHLLSNDLFKKHLAGHIDVIERNILKVRKHGLKKSLSNLDLSLTDIAKVHAAFDSSLQSQDDDKDSSDTESPETQTDTESQARHGLEPATILSPASALQSVSSAGTSKQGRRKTLACDDPSLQQLQEVLAEDRPNPQSGVRPTRRGRLCIPSFEEFRKQRQKEGRGAARAMTHYQSQEAPGDAADAVVSFQPLDTIAEDVASEPYVHLNSATSVMTEILDKQETSDELDQTIRRLKETHVTEQSSIAKHGSEDEGNCHQRGPRQVCSQAENVSQFLQDLQTPDKPLKPTARPEDEKPLCDELSEHQCSSSAEVSEHLQPLDGIGDSRVTSAKEYDQSPHDDKIRTEQRALSEWDETSPSAITIKTSKSLDVEKQEFQTHSLADANECQPSSDADINSFGNRSVHSRSSEKYVTQSCIHSSSHNSGDCLTTSTIVQHPHDIDRCDSGGFTTATSDSPGTPEDCANGATSDDADHSTVPLLVFKRQIPQALFDDFAVSLDTESWTRLFTQIHKPRRRQAASERRNNDRPSAKHKTPMAAVLRSSSDVTEQTAGGGGHEGQRKRRLRKLRPYKSDPLADVAGVLASTTNSSSSSSSDGTLGDMLFLETEETSVYREGCPPSNFPSLEELTEESNSEDSDNEGSSSKRVKKRLSNISTASEDSGVQGQETPRSPHADTDIGMSSPSPSIVTDPQNATCHQCSLGDDPFTVLGDMTEETEEPSLCDKCLQRRHERRETIYEIIETEISFGRDLRILKEEFYVPMQSTGLLSSEQLDTVFINLDELISVNTQLTEKLRAALHHAANTSDHDLSQVTIGRLFIESSTLFLAFEKYCINQAQASAALEQQERERELLRIFLQVSQAENGLLRRMHLKSFLMAPVQRIMKYPLLLNRLYKATASHHSDREDIRQAREKIEDILGHINAKAKGSWSLRTKRKQSEMRRYSLTEKTEVNKVALEVVGWNQQEGGGEVLTSRLWYAQPSDHTWASKKCRNIKFTPTHAVLLTCQQSQDTINMNAGQQAAVVLIKEKNGKYQAVRDPFWLDKCVVTVDPDCDDVFELLEWGREAYIFKAEDLRETQQWVQHLRQQTHKLGQWRRRRNALPNIMLKNI